MRKRRCRYARCQGASCSRRRDWMRDGTRRIMWAPSPLAQVRGKSGNRLDKRVMQVIVLLQLLRRDRRPLLPRLEQAPRPALAHHLHRQARLRLWVLINAKWYKSSRVTIQVAAICMKRSRCNPSQVRARSQSCRATRPQHPFRASTACHPSGRPACSPER